jgi:hypothetical protein
MSYYVLNCLSPMRVNFFHLEVDDDASTPLWARGSLLSPDHHSDFSRAPPEPIEVQTIIDPTDRNRIYPELTWHPIPLFSRRLVRVLRGAGVSNLQIFETRLSQPLGEPAPAADHYLAVNVIGCIAAADMKRSSLNPDVSERMISADFNALVIDDAKAGGQLMFRLAENVSAVLVHERVKAAVEAAGIDTLTWIPPGRWAG